MADMGLGYGSEYQLLRALGHHRESFFQTLRNTIGIDESINWKDYPTDRNSLSLDGEFCEIECFKMEPFYKELNSKWPDFWPVRGHNAQNWDGIFNVGDDWYFVEAKAHISELKSKHKKSIKSDALISRSFQETIDDWFESAKSGDDWLRSPYYQFANRLAFCHFLRKNKINAHIVNIFFLNGFEKPQETRDPLKIVDDKLSVKTIDDWEKAISKEWEQLGVNKASLSGISYEVFVDCLYPEN